MELLAVLSGSCLVFTLAMFCAGLSDLRKMFSTKSTDNIQFLPFLTTDLNNLGWLYYGYMKNDWTLMIVNSTGASLQTIYILTYYFFTPEKCSVLLKTLLSLGVLVLGYCYFYFRIPDVDTRLNQLGLFCSIFTISMYLSPLADLAKIIQTRSTKCLSLPLAVATFLASTSWVLYGWQLADAYIMVPNFPGIVTSILRFWLFWQYSSEQDTYSYKSLYA
ncbi:sugar transporter SWEET1 [Microcaecilia unicolor]|uniref:Sugar transporter SWEET1 n=1 Tax=Microcaecilia unicolor TaxID=1415580 RepID=A0A6P7WYZ7_9AMPH|nr:sugar transporter SWEET1 [Microcaecilia unicolor]